MKSTEAIPSITFERTADDSFRLIARQFLANPLGDVFSFFSHPENLERLTPSTLRFRILSPQPIQMASGTRIDYALRLHGFPLRWQSVIEDYHPPHSFVDRQLRGPYREWIHLHSFRGVNGGTLIEDDVRYRVPGGILANRLFIQPSLRRIFAHRQFVLQTLFP